MAASLARAARRAARPAGARPRSGGVRRDRDLHLRPGGLCVGPSHGGRTGVIRRGRPAGQLAAVPFRGVFCLSPPPMATSTPRHVVAVVGGATAGAEAAGMLADRGVVVVVFDQNARPYGKIEDGLPRWHVKLRRKEYETINDKLSRPGVYFVPCTKIGRDVEFPALVSDWGFSAVLLAHGAWRDRPLPVPGADAYVGKGLVYQNPFIYWFNHFTERGYEGPQYEAV